MNHDERRARLAHLSFRLLHVLALAREILADVTPVTLPPVLTPDTATEIWDAMSRTMILMDEEPLVSIIPDQGREILQQGLAKALMCSQHVATMAEFMVDGEGDKLEEWMFRAAELVISDADISLHVASEELGGQAMDD
ncbi:hypothetical protein ACOQFV_27400 [Nocardiopsis changdeensis]|uniref:Uncharacterized protein n=1 Tax=Nocardiopsis changdeensis TaxID=2831969 RepID=A0ABX8BL97_9ACTN|nr:MULTISPECIES: hypothetical protein [Nocardiopsis]QUX22995.1 hypothetical protein KGD84_00860 [Nocardiopsis changdeensis]QYX38938.1 hypothetical protein K1J57_10310 [Nocardiopsis sp. MT53]